MNLPTWLAAATWHGSLAIALVWLLRPLVRRWAGAQATHALWILVLLELLSPWHPPSPVGLLPSRLNHTMEAPTGATSVRTSVSVESAKSVPAPVAESVFRPSPRPLAWPATLWLLGVAGVLIISGLRVLRASRIVGKGLDISEAPLIREVLQSFPDLPPRLRVRETSDLRSPALAGIWHPVILLPQDWARQWNFAELGCILAHEIGHLRRGDLLWRWAFLLASALHWFNPLVWLAQRSARADQEMACDEWVLARSRSLDLRLYGEVLLKALRLLDRPGFGSPVHATMAESKGSFKRRIRHLSQIRVHGWLASAFVGTLMVLLALILGPAQGEEQPAPATPPVNVAPPVESPKPVAATPTSEPQVEIEARFIEIQGKPDDSIWQLLGLGKNPPDSLDTPHLQGILSEEELQKILRQLNQKKGVDVLSAPRVTTKSGQHAVIEIIREFIYPTQFDPPKTVDLPPLPGQPALPPVKVPSTPTAFEHRNVGVTLEVLPQIADGAIDLTLTPQVVEFLGFINYGGGQEISREPSADAIDDLLDKKSTTTNTINQPVFSTRKITTSVSVWPGQTVLIGGVGRKDQQMVETLEEGWPVRKAGGQGSTKTTKQEIQRYLLIFVTPHIVAPSGQIPPAAPATPSPSPAPQVQKSGSLPHGAPVPGKPGFITSPYAPDQGYVDVRGYESDTKIKCPYTGKIFLVP